MSFAFNTSVRSVNGIGNAFNIAVRSGIGIENAFNISVRSEICCKKWDWHRKCI